MKVFLRPQIRFDKFIKYDIYENILVVTIEGITETFDFSDFPDGKLILHDDGGNLTIDSKLPEIPLMGAFKKNGETYIDIIFSVKDQEEFNQIDKLDWLDLEEFDIEMKNFKKKRR